MILLYEALVGESYFYGVEVFALDVLHEGHLHHILVVGRAHIGRYGGKACHLRGSPTAFAGNNLIRAVFHETKRDGLYDADLADAIGQLLQGFGRKFAAGLIGVGFYFEHRHLVDAGRTAGVHFFLCGDQGVKSASESLEFFVWRHSLFVFADDFACQCEVVLGACRFGVVEYGGKSVARGFGEFHVALDDGFEYEFLKVALHLVVDLVGEAESRVVHGEEEPFNLERRIEFLLYNLYSIEQFTDAFKGEIFTLHGDDDGVGSGQGIDGDESERRRAVNEYVVVLFVDGCEKTFEDKFAPLETQHFDFCAYEVNVGRNNVEPFDVGGVDGFVNVHSVDDTFVDGAFHLTEIHAESGRGIGLRVGIDEQHPFFECGERSGEVH